MKRSIRLFFGFFFLPTTHAGWTNDSYQMPIYQYDGGYQRQTPYHHSYTSMSYNPYFHNTRPRYSTPVHHSYTRSYYDRFDQELAYRNYRDYHNTRSEPEKKSVYRYAAPEYLDPNPKVIEIKPAIARAPAQKYTHLTQGGWINGKYRGRIDSAGKQGVVLNIPKRDGSFNGRND